MLLWSSIALMLSIISTIYGCWRLKSGQRATKVTIIMGVLIAACTTFALHIRGQERGACPLSDVGEIFLFTAWSLSLFYVLTGGNYRMSLLGLFTKPAIALLLVVVLIPGTVTPDPVKVAELDPWKESHAATSVLAFGGLGLGALASLMFLILNSNLKKQKSGGFNKLLPPVNTLINSVSKLLWLGVIILTIGIGCGVISSLESGLMHLILAGGVWLAYCTLLVWYQWKGMPPNRFAQLTLGLFLISCLSFVFI